MTQRLPPVLLVAVALAISVAGAARDPFAWQATALRAIGGVVGITGAGVALAGVVAFRRLGTTVDPRHPERAATLVVSGVYRWTRNPMYLGFVLFALAPAVGAGSPLAALAPALLWWYLERVQIPLEERALLARFGSSFADYAARVGRWLGRRRR